METEKGAEREREKGYPKSHCKFFKSNMRGEVCVCPLCRWFVPRKNFVANLEKYSFFPPNFFLGTITLVPPEMPNSYSGDPLNSSMPPSVFPIQTLYLLLLHN